MEWFQSNANSNGVYVATTTSPPPPPAMAPSTTTASPMMIHSTSASPKGNVKTTTKSLLSLHNTPTTKSAATEPPSRLNVATTTSIPNIFTTAGVILATTMMNTMGTTTDIPIQNEHENQKQECSQNNCCGEGLGLVKLLYDPVVTFRF